jgi:monoamine oxidase
MAALVYAGPQPLPVRQIGPAGVVYRSADDERVLVVFAGAGAARRLAAAPEEERGEALAALAGSRPESTRAAGWSAAPAAPGRRDVHGGHGSYLILGPGDLLSWGVRLGEPHGRVHFAGSEASRLPSYMNGAVVAGERTAREVLAQLD